MTWEHMLFALGALTTVSLRMREPGDWYVESSIEIGGDGMLTGICVTGAKTPEAAVLDYWSRAVLALPSDRHLVARGKRYRWDTFMWREVTP